MTQTNYDLMITVKINCYVNCIKELEVKALELSIHNVVGWRNWGRIEIGSKTEIRKTVPVSEFIINHYCRLL